MSTEQFRLLSRYLDTDGDGTGTKNAVGDYSGAVEEFYIQPSATEIFMLSRLIVTYEDTSGMVGEKYGNLAAALSNGIEIKEVDGVGTITDFTDGIPVKANFHWGRLAGPDVDIFSWSTTPTNDLLVVRYTFAKSGQFLRLSGADSEKLVVYLNDSFTGLITQYFMVQGYYANIKE